jgi:hypothetical protein
MIKEIIIVILATVLATAVITTTGCDSDCAEEKAVVEVTDAAALPGDVTPTLAGDATPTEN